MPLIDITVPAGTLEPDTAQQLQEELAGILLGWEGAPDTEFFREITWVYLHEVQQLAVGGRPGGAPRFRIEISVPEGALSPRRKEGLIADVHAAVTKAAGLDDSNGLHVWTLIRDVPEGNWGAAGQVVQFEALRAAAKSQRAEATSS